MRLFYKFDNRIDSVNKSGLSLVILNAAERSEESLETLMTNQGSRDFSLPLVARNDIQAKVLHQYLLPVMTGDPRPTFAIRPRSPVYLQKSVHESVTRHR